jgi:hypothetical protein
MFGSGWLRSADKQAGLFLPHLIWRWGWHIATREAIFLSWWARPKRHFSFGVKSIGMLETHLIGMRVHFVHHHRHTRLFSIHREIEANDSPAGKG